MGMIGNSLAQGLISGANIQDGTVDTPDIKDSAVTAAKIASAVITPAKLSTGAPTWDTSSNFGIGTATPVQRLHLAQAGQPKIEFEDTTNSSKGRITTGGSTGSMTFDADPDNTKAGTVMTFNVDGTERARVDASGNWLLGTTTAITKATVYGSGNQLLSLISPTGSSTQVGISLSPSMTTAEAAANPAQAAIYAVDSSYSANIIFANKVSGALGNALTERMRIDTSGRMGVGTTNPLTKVDIRGTSANAAATVQIVGTGVSTLLLGQNADGGVIRGQGGNNCITFWTGGAGDTAASGSGTERARIDASGNLTVNGYHVMRFRGGVAWGDVDSYTGSSYDGYYQITFSGHSGWLFSQNSGGSAGTIQMYSTYFDGPWYRSKTDNSSWTSWRQL